MDYFQNSTVKAFFFDLYGTLLIFEDFDKANTDWENIFYELAGIKNNLSKDNIRDICKKILESDTEKIFGLGLTTYETKIKSGLDEHGINLSKDEIKTIADNSLVAWQKNIHLAADAITVLQEIKKSKKVALITNFDHSTHIKRVLHEYGLENIFDLVIISDEVNCKKPDPKIFKIALDHLGFLPNEVVYVGDNIVDDVKGALLSGIAPVLISRNSKSNNNNNVDEIIHKNNLPEFRIIKTLSELINLHR